MAKRKQKRVKSTPGAKPKLRTAQQRAKFLRLLVECGGVKRHACRRFGITLQTLCNEQSRYPEFAAAVEDSRQMAREDVEANVWATARTDADLGLRLLRLVDPRYRPKGEVEHTGHVEHNHEVRITVVEDDGWYGNDAHARANGEAPPRIAPPNSNLVIPGTIQDGGVRAPVGQNGHGPNGHG